MNQILTAHGHRYVTFSTANDCCEVIGRSKTVCWKTLAIVIASQISCR